MLHLLILVILITQLFQAQSFLAWQPLDVLVFIHVGNVRLNTSVLRRVFRLEMHDVVHVEPQVMVTGNMPSETTFTLFVECKPFEVTNEAIVVLVGFHEVFVFSQLRESVNNDTE